MQDLNMVQVIAVWALPVLFAITVHEVAHGWVAKKFGDPTAMMLGRLTLNPLKHIDPIGTVVVPLALVMMGMEKAQYRIYVLEKSAHVNLSPSWQKTFQ